MTLCLCHKSSVECLRMLGPAACRLSSASISKLKGFPPKASEIEAFATTGLNWPLHLLVLSAYARRQLKNAVCHVHSASIPSGSIMQVESDVFVTSPEWCFVQMAEMLSFPQLVLLGFELCGTYSLPVQASGDFMKRDVLTSIVKLKCFIESIEGARGLKLAKQALRHVVPDSASPMETITTLLLCLPVRLGGYGLPTPVLNHRIDIGRSARRVSSKGFYVCDLYWPSARLCVEYDSDRFHCGSVRIASDANRRNALSYLGITVVTMTRAQVLNCDGMDRTAHAIAKQLGWRLRIGGSDWLAARGRLRHLLLNFSNGS